MKTDGIESTDEHGPLDGGRRAALRALAKYSGAIGGAATLTVLSAEDVLAKQFCSTHPSPQPGQNCVERNPAASGLQDFLPEDSTVIEDTSTGGGNGRGRSSQETF